jgi:peptidyl-tRNA hydrolase, PTH1 family
MLDLIKSIWLKITNATSGETKIIKEELPSNMKYLIVGLGNIGKEYEHTRHNIGFDIVEAMAKEAGGEWYSDKDAHVCDIKYKGRAITLIKPTTYMNLSGKAARYWLNHLKIEKENMLVVLDDLNLDFGVLRMREKGSDGGHNGLKHIDTTLGGNTYARLRVGIGSKFHKGQQVNFVLGKWKPAEEADLSLVIEHAVKACFSFASAGIKNTMNVCNGDVLKRD